MLPKSVTSMVTRDPKRSASSAHEVPKAAARPGRPLSTTMSAPAASSMSRRRSSSLPGSRTAARLLALCSANGMLAPTRVGGSDRAGLPVGGSILSTSAPRSASSRVTVSDPESQRSSTRTDASNGSFSLNWLPPGPATSLATPGPRVEWGAYVLPECGNRLRPVRTSP